MAFFLTRVKEGTVWRLKCISPGGEKLVQALSGALCGPDIEGNCSPFLGHGSSAPSRHMCNVLHLNVVQRVKDQPFIGKVIVLKTQSLFVCIYLNYSSSGENAGELGHIWKGCC